MSQVTLGEQTEEQGDSPFPYFEAAWQIGNGVFLEDELYCEWAQARRQTVNVTRHRILHRLANYYIQANKLAHAEKLLLQALEEEPTNEDALYRLMEILDRQDRRQEALRLYKRAADILYEEQETVPGARLQDLAKHFSTEPLRSARPPTIFRAEKEIEPVIFSSSPVLLTYRLSEISKLGVLESQPMIHYEQAIPQQSGSGHTGLLPALKNTISNELLLYRIIKEICCWTGREDGYEVLQATIDHLIRSCDTMEQRDTTSSKAILSRRDVMTLLAGLPTFLLMHESLDQLNTVQIEEFLAQCAASITACWQLMSGNDFLAVGQVLSKYLPMLETLAYQPSRHQKSAAKLAAQARLLASLIGFHQNDLL